MYVVYPADISNTLELELRAHKQFIAYEDLNEDEVMYIFNITDSQYSRIVEPFLEGAYSKICSSYFYTHFNKYTPNGKSLNWRIYHKDDSLARHWETSLGVTLAPGAEV